MHDRSSRAILGGSCLISCFFALSVSASSQEVQFSDLEGMTVEASFKRDQVNQGGAGKKFSARVDGTWTISIASDKEIKFTMRATGHGPGGSRTAKPVGGLMILDESREVTTRGQGEAVWRFADGTLSFMRTFAAGAFRTHFAFSRGPGGLACTYNDAYAREKGKGPIKLISPFNGQESTVLSSKVVSSSCKVVAKK